MFTLPCRFLGKQQAVFLGIYNDLQALRITYAAGKDIYKLSTGKVCPRVSDVKNSN